MSNINPCEKAIKVTDKIMELIEKEEMTLAEVADVPDELARRINKNISQLKQNTLFTFPR